MVIRVLFVDDEAELLAGLSQMLRPRRDRWAMSFAPSAREALSVLSAGDFDVVVTDVKMPDGDGVALLSEVRRQYPSIVRIVLSGESRLGPSARAVVDGHQFVAKPCTPEQLGAAIERSLLLRARLTDPALLRIVGAASCLPSPSAKVVALREALLHDDLHRVKELVVSDVTVSTKVLELVNSAFVGLPRAVSDPWDAVTYLGTRGLMELVMTASLFEAVVRSAAVHDRQVKRMQATSHARAAMAAHLAELAGRSRSETRDVWAGAYLADVGELLLLVDDETTARVEATASLIPPDRQRLGASMGAYLISMWGLPHHLVETAALSHDAPDDPAAHGPAYTWLARTLLEDPHVARHVPEDLLRRVDLTHATLLRAVQRTMAPADVAATSWTRGPGDGTTVSLVLPLT